MDVRSLILGGDIGPAMYKSQIICNRVASSDIAIIAFKSKVAVFFLENVDVRIEELHLDGLHEGCGVEAVGSEVFEEGTDGPLVAAVVRLEVVAGHVV